MTINMEVKKHAMQQLQDGSWKVTFTVHAEDMSMELIQASMGSPYGLAMVPIQYDDTPPNLDHFTASEPDTNQIRTTSEPKSEGARLRIRAVMLCKEESFQRYVHYLSDRDISEQEARDYILAICGIDSRSLLASDGYAQDEFKKIDASYKEWLNPIEEQYKDNLER